MGRDIETVGRMKKLVEITHPVSRDLGESPRYDSHKFPEGIQRRVLQSRLPGERTTGAGKTVFKHPTPQHNVGFFQSPHFQEAFCLITLEPFEISRRNFQHLHISIVKVDAQSFIGLAVKLGAVVRTFVFFPC
jgi:hypothetical protein